MRKPFLFWATVLALVVPVSVSAQCFPEASCRVTEASRSAEVVPAGGTINLREVCGTVKPITTDTLGAVTTSTTTTFTSSTWGGCIVTVCNVGAADSITLDSNANFVSAADVVLGVGDCVIVAEYPKGVWRLAAAPGDNQ
jgi:hypothetical protein